MSTSTRRPPLALTVLPLLGGCAWFDGVKEDVDGLLDPDVIVGLFTIVEPPPAQVDLSALGLGIGMAGTVFLADARNLSALEESPVIGATVEVTGCGATVTLRDEGNGAYTLLPPTALDGCEQPILVERTDVDDGPSATIAFPAAPDFTFPTSWRPGDADVVVPLAGSPFDSALVITADLVAGEIVYSNEPQDVLETYNFLMGTGALDDIALGDGELRADTLMGLGVSGLVKMPNSDLYGANTALSILHGGRTRAWPIQTFPF